MANPVPPYGAAIHAAVAGGDLNAMKNLAGETERWLQQTGNVPAALEVLKAEIAKLQAKGGHGGSVLLYGVAIQNALAKGDLHEMKTLAQEGEKQASSSGELKGWLDKLKAEIAKHEGKNK
jgi:hypothetical protein